MTLPAVAAGHCGTRCCGAGADALLDVAVLRCRAAAPILYRRIVMMLPRLSSVRRSHACGLSDEAMRVGCKAVELRLQPWPLREDEIRRPSTR